jgi:WD40 repeat protein
MNAEDALRITNQIIFTRTAQYLNDLDSELLTACCNGESYGNFASRKNYTTDHIKSRAAKLWKLLSAGLGESINRDNFQQGLERYQQKRAVPVHHPRIDWGEAPDVSTFYGRDTELKTLKQWVLGEHCRTIALLGMGGIGKTALSVRLTQEVQSEFEFVIWRSLREAPPLGKILDDIAELISNRQELEFPRTVNEKITQLIRDFRRFRCLLVLDNLETILQTGNGSTSNSIDYDAYSKLFQRLCESSHQSCLVITSREKSREVAVLEGETLPVRCWRVTGLQATAVHILNAKGVVGSEVEKQQVVKLYDGHPQALMLVATSIRDLFSGQISDFLSQGTVTFNGITRLLDEQFNRLPDLGQTVMYWLAINREPVTIATLLEDIVPQPSRARLLESLEDLRGRSLVETVAGGYTLQNVVMEYMTSRLIEQMREAIATEQLEFLNRFALLKATAKDYVKETQVRLILNSVRAGFANIQYPLTRLLAMLRSQSVQIPGYAGGNIFNLYCYLGEELSQTDFSRLSLRQADLQRNQLHQVNFAHSEFVQSSFRLPFGFVQGIAFSPDGKQLATGTSKGEIRIWRVADFQEVFVLRGHTNWVWQIAFSANGQLLVSASADCTVKLWQIGPETGHCLRTFQGHTDEVYSAAISSDGQIVASGSRDHTIKLWQTGTGDCLQTLQEHTNVICAVAFSPNGQLLASCGYDKVIRLWQISTGRCIRTLEGHREELSTLAFSPDGQLLASAGYEFAIKLWQVNTGECLKTLEGHTARISCVQFSPDGELLVSGSHSPNIKLWRVSTGECLNNLQGHTNLVRTVTFSPDGKILASGGDDQMVKIWRVETGECLKTWRGYSNCVWNVAFSPDGKWLASGNHDQAVRIWSVETGECHQTLWGHRACVWAVAFSPEGRWLASAGNQPGAETLRLWQLDTGQCVKLVGHLGTVHTITFSPDGQLLASGGTDLVVKLWQVGPQQCVNNLQGHTGLLRSVCFSPDGQLLATGADDRTIRLWRVETGECLKIFQGGEDWIWSVTFSPDGQLLAICGEDGTIKLWQVSTGECVRVLRKHGNAIYAVQFSPDGRLLASAGSDSTVCFWQLETGECVRTLQGHTEEIWSIAFSPDGQKLASSSEDGLIKLWHTETGECLATLSAPKPYEGMNITGVTGLSEAQIAILRELGAIEANSAEAST